MSRASCHKCLVWSCSSNPGESSSMSKLKKQVVLCQFCRQGKFGWTKSCKSKSISICVNCADRSEAYLKMTQGSQVENYLIGMLNQLVSQSISPTNKLSNRGATHTLFNQKIHTAQWVFIFNWLLSIGIFYGSLRIFSINFYELFYQMQKDN